MEFFRNNLRHRKNSGGFTLIELLVSMGILALLFLASVPTYRFIKENIGLKNSSYEIVNALRQAQNSSMVSQGGTSHGIHFEEFTYTVYEGRWSTATKKIEYPLVAGVKIFEGAGSEVEFEKLTGEATTTTISVGTSEDKKKNIEVDKLGNIKINE